MERRMVGTVEVIALVDTVQSYDAAAVYPDAGEALREFAAYLDDQGRVALNFAAFLVADGSERVLVDTGWGPEFAGQLPLELAAAAIDPATVGTVIFTHLHGDHTGWNIDRQTGRPLFPNARYLVPRLDWDHYLSRDLVPASFTRDVGPLADSGHLELFEGERALTSSLTAVPTPGHTPGHTSIAIASGSGQGCILGDVVITRIDAERPALRTSFDWDHRIARRTREATVAHLAAQEALVGASHLPPPGFGRFVVREGRSHWEPA